MKLLVTGAGGMLGREVVAAAPRDVVALDHAALDLTDAAAVRAAVERHRPDAVISCAAFTAVDRCETEPALAHAVNAAGPEHLARATAAIGARLVHVSTDYVFDGTKATPYVESDEPNPRSVYGASKLAGERAVLALHPDAVVARTAWVFGRHGANMVKTVLRAKAANPVLRFVDDQRGSPTAAGDLAGLLLALAAGDVTGIVHATNTGSVTWFGFVQEILRQSGDDPTRVVPITTADLDPPRPAPRPANSVLVSEVLPRLGVPALRPYEEALAEVLAAIAADGSV